MAMKLSTGKIKFSIEFDNGDVDFIYFNPNDRELIRRIMDFESSIDERIKKIDTEKYKSKIEDGVELNIDFDDLESVSSLTEEQMTSLKNKVNAVIDIDEEYQRAFMDELNSIFESDISSVVFKHCKPLDAVFVADENGNETSEPYILVFLKEFHKEVQKYQNKITPEMKKHINKYAK
jgi:hypothetical protein